MCMLLYVLCANECYESEATRLVRRFRMRCFNGGGGWHVSVSFTLWDISRYYIYNYGVGDVSCVKNGSTVLFQPRKASG